MKQQINFRASNLTARQLAALIARTGMNQTDIVQIAIDRMYREEKMNTKMTPTQKAIEIAGYSDPMTIGQWNEAMKALGYDQLITEDRGDSAGYIDDNGYVELLTAEPGTKESRLLKIAERVYSEVYGNIDDKRHADEYTTEIYDWLYNGDNPDGYTLEMVPDFVKEWKEYSAME